jgi:major membrane immunogen (membrane-anchored lipoprotein)
MKTIVCMVLLVFLVSCNKTFEPDPTMTIGNQVLKAIKKNGDDKKGQ